MTQPKVVVYSQPSCPPCHMVKEFLSHHNVKFEQYNVAADAKARDEMIDKYESMSTPTIVIGDQVITGFDPAHLTKLLNLNA